MSQTAFTPDELNQGFVFAIQIVAKAGAEENIIAKALQSLIQPTMAVGRPRDLNIPLRPIEAQ